MDTIIRGGTIVTSTAVFEADLGLNDGAIAAIGDLSGVSAARDVQAKGLHILPGAIDTQVHFREPGLTHKEDLESGTRAAVLGGVTTVFEMPNTVPSTTTKQALEEKLGLAKGRCWSDYAFFVGASTDNLDQLAALEALPGTPGVKMFMGSSTGTLLVSETEDVRKVMQNGRRPMPVHSEEESRLRMLKETIQADHPRMHPTLRDAQAALDCTKRLLGLQAETGRHVHVLHISTLDELPVLREAKRAGRAVTCEVTPQHLLLDASLYETIGTKLQMNPPVRSAEHRDAIQWALKVGLFDVFGSDHAPHTLEEKAKPYPQSPSGMPGVQTLLPLVLRSVHEGLLTLSAAVRMTSSRPASLYGIANKGEIQVGYDADFAIVDLDRAWTIEHSWLASRCGWSPYEGQAMKGWVEQTWVRGNLVAESGQTVGAPVGQATRFTWKDG